MSKFSMADLLNSQSKAEAPKAPKTERDDEIRNIPIDKIIPSENNKYGIRDIEDLAATIETVGLLHNLVVKEGTEPGTYELVSGERRLEALKLLVQQGKTEYASAPCKIEKTNDPIISELQLLFANSTARDLTDYEKTYQAKRIKELLLQLKQNGYKFKGRMREIVADMLKVSPAQMGRMESINKNLSPDFKEEFKAGKINATAAYELSRLPEQEQGREMQKYRESGSIEIKDVKEHREKAKEEQTISDLPDGMEELAESAEYKARHPEWEPQPEQREPEQAQRQQAEPEQEIIRQLRAIATDFEQGNDGSSFDICGVCREAADLIAELEGRLKE
ncbi:ParB/RepB/Spo0J family partition protein [Caproicibacter fermentans]|uniref:ParB/RepB/Spo0J family partition protein n=1 Tax=Caproicibacter fermentans TaxID=2576756 RepID=A0A7G8TDZ4_9FIRM|nr:ParB/RepB/Spo0J family partition protein [Caproicibacter fermentans]QNK41835.1 ParB/RepB/Spo0J family partition protein [Caproicibacter fermentans]